MRVEALSARGELSEGVLRLSGGSPRFERRALNDTLIALEIDYVLEADLGSAAVRAPSSGDLLVAASRPAAAVYVASLWQGAGGLLDIASAIIRPFTAPASPAHVVLAWKLVERDHRARTLFEHAAPEPPLARNLPTQDERRGLRLRASAAALSLQRRLRPRMLTARYRPALGWGYSAFWRIAPCPCCARRSCDTRRAPAADTTI